MVIQVFLQVIKWEREECIPVINQNAYSLITRRSTMTLRAFNNS
jgi:hypothetical protein